MKKIFQWHAEMADKVDEIPRLPRHRKPKNKPADSSWRQQNLSSKRPVLTVNNVCPSVIVLGLIIFGLGLLLFFSVEQSLEVKMNYTDCLTSNKIPAKILASQNLRPRCSLNITLDKNFTDGTVKFYYQLENFYQNFRTYSASRNDLQLEGDLYQTDGCEPYDCVFAPGYDKNSAKCSIKYYQKNISFPIVPCGAIANSLFNDTFELWYNPPNESPIKVPLSVEGVLSKAERRKKFKNPENNEKLTNTYPGNGCSQFINANAVPPPNWSRTICDLGISNDTDDDFNNIDGVGWALTNIDFEVWMKTSALPNFRKPYRTLDQNSSQFFSKNKGLLAGEYTVIINYNYNVQDYNVKKYFVIARESWTGPRNFFLPVAYMISGCFILCSMTVLFIITKVKERYHRPST